MAVPTAPSSLLAALALVLATFVTRGETIKCYSCNSMTSPDCGDPFKSSSDMEVECSPTVVRQSVNDATHMLSNVLSNFAVDVPEGTMQIAFVCQKLKKEVSEGKYMVARTCAFNPETVNTCPSGQTGVECVHCNSELCNGAPAMTAAFVGVRLLTLLLLPAVWLRLLAP